MTRIVVLPTEAGRCVTESMEIDFRMLLGIGRIGEAPVVLY